MIEWAKRRNNDAIDNNPIAMSADKAYQAMAQKRIGPENRPHKLTIDDMIAIVESMSDPKYIVYQSNGRYVEVVEYETSGKKKALAVLEIGNYKPEWTMNGYEDGLYNMLVTTFPPDSGVIADLLNNKQNKIIYNKKKDASRGTPGSMVPSVSNETSFFKESIPQSTPKVNSKFSLSFDSTGSQLTEEQHTYFKNSKVRDAQGRLQVMYQGAAEEFYTFDKKKSKASNLYGRGFYFTNSADQAKLYGTARSYYLNITHPLSTDKKTISREQMRKFLTTVAENEDYSIENYGTYDVDKVLRNVYDGDRSDFAMLYDVSLTAIGDLVEAAELFNEINGTEYDGFILPTECVIFRSEQAKLTANTSPTINPDTRYSLPMYPKLPDAAEVEVELNERDWGFDWSDENIRKNLAKIHEYLDQKYPNVDISITFDREKNFIAVRSVSNPVDFDELSKIDNELYEFLLSIDVKEEQIGQHLSLFRKVEDKMAVGKRLRNKSFFHSMLCHTV